MENDIYRSPSADLTLPAGDTPKKWINYTLLGFFVSPLIAAIVFIAPISALNYFLYGNGIWAIGFPWFTSLAELGSRFVVFASLIYGYLFVFGLPTHYLSGKFYKRKLYLYVLAGIAPALALIVAGVDYFSLRRMLVLVPVLTATGVCFALFWYISVWLSTKER